MYADNILYHPTGALSSLTFGNQLTESITLNNRLRPETWKSGPLDLTYSYEPNGNVSTITDPRPDRSSAFDYDGLDRLTSVTGFGATTFTYDDLGNRLTKGSGGALVSYAYSGTTNRLMTASSVLGEPETGTFEYDPVGNMRFDGLGSEFTYSAGNQMASATVAGSTTNYFYNAGGERVQKTSAAGQQYFVHGLGGQLLADYAALLMKTAPSSGSSGSNANVTLTWTSVPGATYSVCWDTTNNSTCDAGWQANGSSTSKALTGLAPGTYYWQARATTGSGTAEADNTAWWSFTITAGGLFKIGPGNGLTGLPANLTMQWSVVPGDTSYWYCFDQSNNDSCDTMWWPSGGTPSVWWEGLAAGTYYWQARAQAAGGSLLDADNGQWWSFTVGGGGGGGGGGFTKIAPSAGLVGLSSTVTLTWATVPNEGYVVCWDTIDNGACDTAWAPVGGDTSKLAEDLSAGIYYWQVKTSDNPIEANGGVWWAFAVGTPPITFSKQTPGAGAILTTNVTTLSWTTPPGASWYESCVDPVDNNTCDTMWMPGVPAWRVLTGLTDGVYFWQVRATTQTGSSYADLGAWRTFTVDAPDPIREYIYLGSRLLASITLSTGAPPVTSFYHTDALGSVRATTATNGATLLRHDYLAFGEGTPLGGDPRRYLGQELDAETGFDHFGARQYRNVWGRFTSVDPIVSPGATTNPQLWNRYAYGLNAPLRYSDPSGLRPEELDSFDGGVVDVAGLSLSAARSDLRSWVAAMDQRLEQARINAIWTRILSDRVLVAAMNAAIAQMHAMVNGKPGGFRETGFFIYERKGKLGFELTKPGPFYNKDGNYPEYKMTASLPIDSTTLLVAHLHPDGGSFVQTVSRYDRNNFRADLVNIMVSVETSTIWLFQGASGSERPFGFPPGVIVR